jgi:predicted nuclease of predicted toxin-antitoxin system
MKLLLDECVDVRFRSFIPEHEVRIVQEMRWLGKVNGELLQLTNENGFNVFITTDKKLQYQQNISQYNFAVVILDTPRSTLENLKILIPSLIVLLPNISVGNVYMVK